MDEGKERLGRVRMEDPATSERMGCVGNEEDGMTREQSTMDPVRQA